MRNLFFLLFLTLISCQSKVQKSSNSDSELLPPEIANFPIIKIEPQHQVMTLGSFHFNRSNDGSDVVGEKHIDVKTPENQAQLDTLIAALEKFNPTKIAVEWRPRNQEFLDSLYQEYQADRWPLGRNEMFQIGFRLAKKLGLDKVYCVDNRPPMPETLNEIDDFQSYAVSINQHDLWHSYDDANDAFNNYMDEQQGELLVLDYLKLMNSERYTMRTKQLWVTGLVNLGVYDKYIGADLTGHWYRRNARIFANVSNLSPSLEKERILIIYGGAHKWILDELFDAAPDYKVKQIRDLLSP